MPEADSRLTIAVSKGRILKDLLPLFETVGIVPSEDPERSRSLIIETVDSTLRLVIIRASDVPTYVEYGAADLGVAGKDVLLEYQGDGLYEPLDLGVARCKLVVAGLPGAESNARRLRVATKYVRTTRHYFAARGIQAEVIKLYGSMELAPLVGLADLIVDLVDSGNTLRANGLVVLDEIMPISSRLVINKAAMKTKSVAVADLVQRFRAAVALRT
jgi:ATP phosphoribosyltransferase